jgi:SAM-dependent methyltransferase
MDIGTGDGAFLTELLDAGAREVVGIEPSLAPIAIEPSLAPIAAASPRVRKFIRQGVFNPEDFEPGRFQLISSFQTLEHVPDPLDLCRSAHRLLRRGSALMVVCHDRRAPLNRLLGRRSPIYDIEHLQLFLSPVASIPPGAQWLREHRGRAHQEPLPTPLLAPASSRCRRR